MTTLTDKNIKHAVDEWLAEPVGQSATYGDNIGAWDVSGVTVMTELFKHGRSKFNANGVEAAGTLDASGFNEDLSSWNTSLVTDMRSMFYRAYAFNQPLDWNVSQVTDMNHMFFNARAFNQPLDWDVSKVTNMEGMFWEAAAFNQPLDWVVSKVTDMSSMFESAEAFNQPLNSWNVSQVTNKSYMFAQSAFNQPLNSWDVFQVTNMSYMFDGAAAFNQNIRNWKVADTTNMYDMFTGATAYLSRTPPVPTTLSDDYFNQAVVAAGNICFLGDEKVATDQGKVRFDMLTPMNTIRGNAIKKIIKVINSKESLIFIKKHSLGHKVPSRNTYISENHGVYVDLSFIKSNRLDYALHPTFYKVKGKHLVFAKTLTQIKGVSRIPRSKHDILYNVLLDHHGIMVINNMVCETLHPDNELA